MGTFTLDHALELAQEAHATQLDKAGEAYIQHPIRVMQKLSTESERMTALLHDVLEDTSLTAEDLRAAGCPPDVLDAVEALTKRPGETLSDSIDRAAANQLAFVVKMADIADNSDPVRLDRLDPGEARRLSRKYIESKRLLLQAYRQRHSSF